MNYLKKLRNRIFGIVFSSDSARVEIGIDASDDTFKIGRGKDFAGGVDLEFPAAGSAWVDATLLNSWVTLGGTTNVPGYYKDALGFVHLRGVLKSGTGVDADMFTLPAGFRPAAIEWQPGTAGDTGTGTITKVQVLADGTVNVEEGGSTTASSIDGVTFLAV